MSVERGLQAASMNRYRYTSPLPNGPVNYLVALDGDEEEDRFPFYDRLEIGRGDGRAGPPGLLLVADPTISSRHCTLTCRTDGRCFVRDSSRNGTRLNGRRLVPNVETEVRPNDRLEIGEGARFVVIRERSAADQAAADFETMCEGGTACCSNLTVATVLVGDIRDYTGLVRRAPVIGLQRSVERVFESLNGEVVRHGGTVKEYQGDAIFAFWESAASGQHAVNACRAALGLVETTARLASDRSTWALDGFPLAMDWALATGVVAIDALGTSQRVGLSMIGEPVVLAFRLESLANDNTGPILTCETTRALAADAFAFRDLGEMQVKGFDKPARTFALEGPLPA